MPVLGGLVRIIWNFTEPMTSDFLAMNVMFLMGALGLYVLAMSVLLRASLSVLSSPSLRVLGAVALAAAYAGAVIHLLRFIPSIWTAMSVVVMVLMMVTATNALLLGLWVFVRVLGRAVGEAARAEERV